ncbi:MAG TPA: hypothetical protein PL143_14235 [Rhodocyclaceae bacterium]|nr:hypothetical protein [Rhodocyclaceae bacterium]
MARSQIVARSPDKGLAATAHAGELIASAAADTKNPLRTGLSVRTQGIESGVGDTADQPASLS